MRTNLNSNSSTLALLPALFGFIATNSIVVLVIDDHSGRRTVHMGARYDSTAPLDVATEFADVLPLRQDDGTHRSVLLVAIDDSENQALAGAHLDPLQRHFTARSVTVIKRLHTTRIDAGHTWTDIDTGETGTTIDYRTSEIGLHMAVEHGRAVRNSRDDIAAEFAPTEQAPAPETETGSAEFTTQTIVGMSTAFEDPTTLTPQLAANAGLLISDKTIRDALLIVSTERPESGAAVWTNLARQLRGQSRIEALALAVACFYCAGDTVRTSVALEAAHDTAVAAGRPDTNLVTLLDTAVQTALPPAKLRQFFAQFAAKPPAE